MTELHALFASLPSTIIDCKDVVVLFDFSDEGSWVVTVDDGSMTCREGSIEDPGARMCSNAATWLGLFDGSVNGMMAMMQKKIRVSGNIDAIWKIKAQMTP